MTYTQEKHPSRDGFILTFENGHVWSVIDVKSFFKGVTDFDNERMERLLFPFGSFEGMRYTDETCSSMDGTSTIRGKSLNEVIEEIVRTEEDKLDPLDEAAWNPLETL